MRLCGLERCSRFGWLCDRGGIATEEWHLEVCQAADRLTGGVAD
jgi:hypothetical protein